MRILIIHQNFPGQFRHVAKEWSQRPGWQVVGIGRDTAPGLHGAPSLKLVRYKTNRPVGTNQHHYLRKMEDAVLHGQAVARILLGLKRQGFTPDAILAHPGWGETLYAKDVFPEARLVHFAEWYYNAEGADIGFDPEFPTSFDDRAGIRSWNALHLLNLENCDLGRAGLSSTWTIAAVASRGLSFDRGPAPARDGSTLNAPPRALGSAGGNFPSACTGLGSGP